MTVILGSTPAVSATTTQWFPSDGVSTIFPVSHNVVLQNGSTFTTNKFDLYTFSTMYIAIPSINKYLFNQTSNPFTSIANATEIIYFYNYSQHTVDQLNRTHSFSWGSGNVVTGTEIDIYVITWTSGAIYRPMQGNNDSVYKNDFFTTITSMSFLDYFNCSKALGETIQPYSYIITEITSETITAKLTDPNTNTTYIANRDGKVLMYSLECKGFLVTDAGAVLITLIFGAYEPSGIPAFPVFLTVFSLLLGVLLIKIGGRRKISL